MATTSFELNGVMTSYYYVASSFVEFSIPEATGLFVDLTFCL